MREDGRGPGGPCGTGLWQRSATPTASGTCVPWSGGDGAGGHRTATTLCSDTHVGLASVVWDGLPSRTAAFSVRAYSNLFHFLFCVPVHSSDEGAALLLAGLPVTLPGADWPGRLTSTDTSAATSPAPFFFTLNSVHKAQLEFVLEDGDPLMPMKRKREVAHRQWSSSCSRVVLVRKNACTPARSRCTACKSATRAARCTPCNDRRTSRTLPRPDLLASLLDNCPLPRFCPRCCCC